MHRNNIKFMYLILVLSSLLLATGCKRSKNDIDIIRDKPVINDQYTVNTAIAYSTGDDSNWSYVKEGS